MKTKRKTALKKRIKIFAQRKSKKGTAFKIQQTGLNWTLYVKEKGSTRWDKIQSMANARILKQVMDNQREFRK